jgi:hypothetical protein
LEAAEEEETEQNNIEMNLKAFAFYINIGVLIWYI